MQQPKTGSRGKATATVTKTKTASSKVAAKFEYQDDSSLSEWEDYSHLVDGDGDDSGKDVLSYEDITRQIARRAGRSSALDDAMNEGAQKPSKANGKGKAAFDDPDSDLTEEDEEEAKKPNLKVKGKEKLVAKSAASANKGKGKAKAANVKGKGKGKKVIKESDDESEFKISEDENRSVREGGFVKDSDEEDDDGASDSDSDESNALGYDIRQDGSAAGAPLVSPCRATTTLRGDSNR